MPVLEFKIFSRNKKTVLQRKQQDAADVNLFNLRANKASAANIMVMCLKDSRIKWNVMGEI